MPLQPSARAVRKARLAAAYRQHKNGRKYFRPLLITGSRVDFFYGGYTIRFVWETGRVLRIATREQHLYLQPEDYALLHSEAAILMQAAHNGYKTRAHKEAPTQSTHIAKQLSFDL